MIPKAVGNKLLIRIDKAAQKSKTTLKSGLIVHPEYEYMLYNLQYGQIVSVGGDCDADYKVGRTAILHHTVESDGDMNLVKVEDNGDEIRVVKTTSDTYSFKVYGVFDEDGNIIATGNFIFCLPEVPRGVEREVIINQFTREAMDVEIKKTESGLYTAALPKNDDDAYQVVCEVVSVPAKEKEIKKHDMILCDAANKYPIDLFGKTYWTFMKDFIHSIV